MEIATGNGMMLPHESRLRRASNQTGILIVRYALYFTPAASDSLTLSAARWLGRNAFNGAPLDQPAATGFDQPALKALTADPRRYGFHATLKEHKTKRRSRRNSVRRSSGRHSRNTMKRYSPSVQT